jgi:electron transfer flavoprotein alpha subunit
MLGHCVESYAATLAEHGADVVLLADAPELAPYTAEAYAWVISGEIERRRPWAVLFPATSFGSDIAPRVAARLTLGLTGDCLGVEIDAEGHLLQLKPAFGGRVVAPIASRTLPAMATIRPGALPAYAPNPARTARVVPLDLAGMPAPGTRVLSTTLEGNGGLALDTARLVVCVGMGVGGPEALEEIDYLAAALGKWLGLDASEVAIGGTRKVVDEGWLPRQQQIGITGRMVSPDLYLAIGVQGKFNHVVGILGAGTIAAVNSDPSAPIFAASDFGFAGDWRAFARALLAALEGQQHL